MAAHSMCFSKSLPTRISTDPGHGTRILFLALLLFYFLTPTANAESWAVEAFSLCMFLTSTKLSEWSPMELRAPAQGSSQDQCI